MQKQKNIGTKSRLPLRHTLLASVFTAGMAAALAAGAIITDTRYAFADPVRIDAPAPADFTAVVEGVKPAVVSVQVKNKFRPVANRAWRLVLRMGSSRRGSRVSRGSVRNCPRSGWVSGPTLAPHGSIELLTGYSVWEDFGRGVPRAAESGEGFSRLPPSRRKFGAPGSAVPASGSLWAS